MGHKVKTLKQAIANGDLLSAGLLASALTSCNTQFNCVEYQARVRQWSVNAKREADIQQVGEAEFSRLIAYFYRDMAFSGNLHHDFSCKHSLLDQVLDYRTGVAVTLAMVFQALAKNLGFEVQGVNFPGHFLLRYVVNQDVVKYIDPKSGNCLSDKDLNYLYFSVLTEIDNEVMPAEALHPASHDEIMVHYLHQIKAAYINQRKFEQALMTVELLIELCPNNPYERRDRGVLLHELQCPQLAIADYQYFIRQCPKDPAAPFLELQVRSMDVNPPVMH